MVDIILITIICIYFIIVMGVTETIVDKNDGIWWKLLILFVTIISFPTMLLLTIGHKLGKWVYKED